jgi:hypothetical protein
MGVERDFVRSGRPTKQGPTFKPNSTPPPPPKLSTNPPTGFDADSVWIARAGHCGLVWPYIRMGEL